MNSWWNNYQNHCKKKSWILICNKSDRWLALLQVIATKRNTCTWWGSSRKRHWRQDLMGQSNPDEGLLERLHGEEITVVGEHNRWIEVIPNYTMRVIAVQCSDAETQMYRYQNQSINQSYIVIGVTIIELMKHRCCTEYQNFYSILTSYHSGDSCIFENQQTINIRINFLIYVVTFKLVIV